VSGQGIFEKLTRREYAMIACAVGSLVLALLPFALHWAGTRWSPGVQRQWKPAAQLPAESARVSKKRLSIATNARVESRLEPQRDLS